MGWWKFGVQISGRERRSQSEIAEGALKQRAKVCLGYPNGRRCLWKIETLTYDPLLKIIINNLNMNLKSQTSSAGALASKPSPFARVKQQPSLSAQSNNDNLDQKPQLVIQDLDYYLHLDQSLNPDMNIQEQQNETLSSHMIQQRTGLQQSEADKLMQLMKKYENDFLQESPSFHVQNDVEIVQHNLNKMEDRQTKQDSNKGHYYEQLNQERLKRVNEIKRKLKSGENSLLQASQQEEDDDSKVQNHQEEQLNSEENGAAPISQSFFNDELSQILIQEDPQLLEDIINLLPQDDQEERNRIIDIVNKILNGQASDAEIKAPNNAFSVHNRLFAYAQARQQGLIGRIDAPSTNKQPGSQYYFNPNLMINRSATAGPRPSDNLSSHRKANPGHQLYQQFLDKQQRLKVMQESQSFFQEQERVKSKVNIKSHQLAYRKLEKDLAMAVMSVDREGLNSLEYSQIGELFQIIGIFKYSFNNNEKIKKQKSKGLFQITTFKVKVEERKMREDEFLFQFWLKLNPLSEERVDSHIVLEFLKLIYDPYINTSNEAYSRKQEELIQQYIQAIKQFYNCTDLNPYLQANEGEHPNWSVSDLMRALRYLTDNFSAFKLGVSGSGIKIPSERQLKIQYEIGKELTHRPQINQKSEMLEKRHYAKFFDKLHQDILTQVESNRDQNLDENQRNVAGRIVSQSVANGGFLTLGDNRQQTSLNNAESDLLSQLQTIKRDPSKLKVPTISRIEVLLEKEELKKRKLKELQLIQEAVALRECTFHPQINATQNSGGYSQASHNDSDFFLEGGVQNKVSAHERLWELSKAKKLHLQQQKPAFDQELEELQECTFQPQINHKSRKVVDNKRGLNNAQEKPDQPQYIKGYEQTVQRLKKAKEQNDLKKAKLENMGRSKNNFSGHPTISKPFQLQTEQQRQQQLSQVNSPPLIDVEITIATGKVVHLTIREGDDMRSVTRNFCRTYALNEQTRRKLEQHIEEYIQTQLNPSPMIDEQYLHQNEGAASQVADIQENYRDQSEDGGQHLQQPEYQEYQDHQQDQSQLQFQLLKTQYKK